MSEVRKRPSRFIQPPEDVQALIVQSADRDENIARKAMRELAKAIEEPIRKAVWDGGVLDGIYAPIRLSAGATADFQLDLIAPGNEKEHVAYTIPARGRIPERSVDSGTITVRTYDSGNSINWPLKLARDSRYDVLAAATEIFEAGLRVKDNRDGWYTILAAGASRNAVIYDSTATPGAFSLRLITLMQQAMRRRGGGNSTTLFPSRLTDLYVSPEALAGMRNLTHAQIDDVTRREIFLTEDGYIGRIFGVFLHDLFELGVDQEYQTFYLSPDGIGGSLQEDDVELVVGLDLQRNDSFVNPIREEIEIFEDMGLHRSRRGGIYGWKEHGFGVLDNRRVILGSL